jgi:hypothetical protein
VLGGDTLPLWVDIAEFLRSALPQVDECTIDGVGHLLHIRRPGPVAQAMAEFLGQHVIGSDELAAFERASPSDKAPAVSR